MHSVHKRRKKRKVYESLYQKIDRLSSSPYISEDDRKRCQDLIQWRILAHVWTEEQKTMAADLAAKLEKVKPFYLYAITDGEHVKLGYSCDIKSRLGKMQTGHPKELGIVWTKVIGIDRNEAAQLERDLHIKCSQYRVRGEWFGMGCMSSVFEFESAM